MRLRSLLLAALTAVITFSGTSASASPSTPCSYGDARQQFETFPLTVEGVPPCQFRLFFQGQTFTFTEDDFFLGGIVFREWFNPPEVTSEQAVARLQDVQVRTWIERVTATGVERVEQPLARTGTKRGHDQVGTYVWEQWGFITQLAPGQYRSVTELRSTLRGDRNWTVHLVVTP